MNKDSVKIIVAVVLLAGAGFVWWKYGSGSGKGSGKGVPQNMPLACDNCGKSYVGEVSPDDLPTKCKLCGNKTLWRAVLCEPCHVVVPLIMQEPNNPNSGKPKCPEDCAKGGEKLRVVTPQPKDLTNP